MYPHSEEKGFYVASRPSLTLSIPRPSTTLAHIYSSPGASVLGSSSPFVAFWVTSFQPPSTAMSMPFKNLFSMMYSTVGVMSAGEAGMRGNVACFWRSSEK